MLLWQFIHLSAVFELPLIHIFCQHLVLIGFLISPIWTVWNITSLYLYLTIFRLLWRLYIYFHIFIHHLDFFLHKMPVKVLPIFFLPRLVFFLTKSISSYTYAYMHIYRTLILCQLYMLQISCSILCLIFFLFMLYFEQMSIILMWLNLLIFNLICKFCVMLKKMPVSHMVIRIYSALF